MNKEINHKISNIKEKLANEFYETVVTYEKIISIGKTNNGYITSKEITQKNISREYLHILEKKGAIEKVARGIYILKETYPDAFYIFQLKYPKTIFSHQTALFFHNLTEEYPYNYDITCSRNYNVKDIKKHNLFYVKKELIDLGKIKIKTNYGNYVNKYNIERCICDLIRNENRMDKEQLYKSLRNILNNKKIDMSKITEYAKKLKCHKKVIKVLEYYD